MLLGNHQFSFERYNLELLAEMQVLIFSEFRSTADIFENWVFSVQKELYVMGKN